MKLIDLRKALEPHGWEFDGASLLSPSGGFWVTESMLQSPAQVYRPVARRREMALREGYPEVREYQDLMGALEADPVILILASRVRLLGEIASAWATDHGCSVTLWDFNLPGARVTARHPFGGIACIDCQLEEDEVVSVTPMHWRDDSLNGIRRSWRQSIPPCALSAEPLIARIEVARQLLLDPRDEASYRVSKLAGDRTATAVAANNAWEHRFEILH